MQTILVRTLFFRKPPHRKEAQAEAPTPPTISAAVSSWSQAARDAFRLLCLTAAALLIHGYHLGIEDMAVYLPAIKKLINPALYPFDANFFILYTQWTSFHRAVAASATFTHIPLDWLLFLYHILSIFLVLLGCLQLSRKCFREPVAQWAGVTMIATLLTLPVAGTALFIVDQHLHPRTFATAFLLFGAVAVLERRPIALLWIFLTAMCHPTMAVYGTFHLAVLAWAGPVAEPALALAAPPFGPPANPIWREVMSHRDFQYPFRWAWYEWLGALAPIAFLEYFARLGRREQMPVFARVCRRFAISTSLGIAGAVFFTEFFPSQTWARLEPMRILHFTYIVFLLSSGALLGKYVLHARPLRWALLFVPLACTMFYFQRQEFPSSYHIEWPGRAPRNAWVQAFDWARENTPRDALFALDPLYMKRPGEDYYGFRGFAERSMMADNGKDPSVVEVFPNLAWQWKLEVSARENWEHFTLADFERLKKNYGVTWVIVERPGVAGLRCPYSNDVVMVCQIP